jgi:hypothetical protein
MHDGVTNRYSFEMNERPINLVSLTPKQIYEATEIEEGEDGKVACISMRPSLLTKFFLVLMMMLFFDMVLIC